MAQLTTARRRSRDRGYNLLGMLFALGLTFGAILYGIPAAASGNPLFFLPGAINQEPVQVIVYHEGQQLAYFPGDAEYEQLVDSVYEVIGDQNGFISLGWSASRFSQARNEGSAVEMIYDEPVRLPLNRVDIADVYRLFVPLDVFGTGNPEVIFRGGDSYWGDPIRVPSLDPVRAVVDEIVSTQ
ncbi:MAG: hypothetical protein GYB68_09510 [Chloroflexi bacterium]|nr:hypothetical protein [Chloroflexota bacterium]